MIAFRKIPSAFLLTYERYIVEYVCHVLSAVYCVDKKQLKNIQYKRVVPMFMLSQKAND